MATVFIARRFLSSSSLLCRQPVIRPERIPTNATPEYLELLEKSLEKSMGHWSKMSNEEMRACKYMYNNGVKESVVRGVVMDDITDSGGISRERWQGVQALWYKLEVPCNLTTPIFSVIIPLF